MGCSRCSPGGCGSHEESPAPVPASAAQSRRVNGGKAMTEVSTLRHEVHQHLLASLTAKEAVTRATVESAVCAIAPLTDATTFERVVSEVLADVNGLGALEALMADPDVSDVMV